MARRRRGRPVNGVQSWHAGFLPPVYHGTWLRAEGSPILNLRSSQPRPAEVRDLQRRLLSSLDRIHRQWRPGMLQLDAVVLSRDGRQRITTTATGESESAVELGQHAADDLLASGASELIRESRGRT